jgi:hypothetical protein
MFISDIYSGLCKVLSNMSSPSLPVRSIDALTGRVTFVNGVEYDLISGERVK